MNRLVTGGNMDISELLAKAQTKGYTHNFAVDGDRLHINATDKRFTNEDCWIVDSQSVDGGTDPGDDATLYLIETHSGERGFVIVSDSFHADPAKAAFVDELQQRLHTT